MRQEIKSLETQHIIVHSAFQLFYKNGYLSTSIPEILQDTGLSKGAFYHHFQNKKDIGVRVIKEIVRKRIYDGMIAPLGHSSNKNIIALLEEIFSQRIKNFTKEEKEWGCPANNLINELGCQDGQLRLLLKEVIDEWKAKLINVLEQAQIKGEIRKSVNVASTATYLISAFEGVRGLRKVYDDDAILEDYLQGVVGFLRSLS